MRTIARHWFPLALSFELMMLEGPSVQGAIGRLPGAALNLAAWGLVMQISLLIESPVIMLLATSIALVRDAPSYRALRTFVVRLLALCTAVTGLLGWTPLFGIVTGRLMGEPESIVAVARPAFLLMLAWSAAIGWRRFHQGVLVRTDQTRLVTVGTAIRLLVTVTVAVVLTLSRAVPGAVVGACAVMSAVISESVATWLFARPAIRVVGLAEPQQAPSQREILHFHMPLAATTALTLAAQPLTAAALAHLPHPTLNLAALPVAFIAVFVLRGWGFALQEITVAHYQSPAARPTLARFSLLVGAITSGLCIVLASTRLLDWYLAGVVAAPREIFGMVRLGVATSVALPLLTAVASWTRGVLVARKQTGGVYRGMAINLATHAAVLVAGALLKWPGMVLMSAAFTSAAAIELAYLARLVGGGARRRMEPAPATA